MSERTVPSRPALRRLPALATTGIGSLPFDAPTAAVRHATRAYDLPFVPQLPRHDGDMLAEWLGPQWSSGVGCGWSAERDRERPVAWEAAIEALEAGVGAGARPRRPRAGRAVGAEGSCCPGRPVTLDALRLVKLQVTGPVTLAVALERAAGRPGTGAAVVSLAREVAGWLAANVAAQVSALAAIGLDVVLLADEPGLQSAGLRPDVTDLWDPLRAGVAAWGLHLCCQVPWGLVDAAQPDVLSFDVTRYAVGGPGVDVLAALAARGGRIAWGALDPVAPDGPEMVAARVGAGLGALTGAGLAVEDALAASLLTPACGTGRLSVQRERLVAATLGAGGEIARATVAARATGARAA